MFQGETIAKDKLKAISQLVEPWFIFALVWGVGGTCDGPSRKMFSSFIREKCQEENIAMPFPEHDLVYDFMLDDGGASQSIKGDDEEEDEKKSKKRVSEQPTLISQYCNDYIKH